MGTNSGCPPRVFLRKNGNQGSYLENSERKGDISSRRKSVAGAWNWGIGAGKRNYFSVSRDIITRGARGFFAEATGATERKTRKLLHRDYVRAHGPEKKASLARPACGGQALRRKDRDSRLVSIRTQ